MFNYNMSINKSTKITPFHATFNYNPRVPLWSGVEHRFDKHLKRQRERTHRSYIPAPSLARGNSASVKVKTKVKIEVKTEACDGSYKIFHIIKFK
jgi:hypothetical protein